MHSHKISTTETENLVFMLLDNDLTVVVRELDPKKNKIAAPPARVGLFGFSDRKSHCDDNLTGCTI